MYGLSWPFYLVYILGKRMFTSNHKKKDFIFSSRYILRLVSQKLGCPTKWQGYANMLCQHDNVDIMLDIYLLWCQEIAIHINMNYSVLEANYPRECVNAVKAVMTCYNQGKSPNGNRWKETLSK